MGGASEERAACRLGSGEPGLLAHLGPAVEGVQSSIIRMFSVYSWVFQPTGGLVEDGKANPSMDK